ncbi:MAG: glycosyltransferase family 4 protein [Clostridia bacterium]|nr:glycosyltransferase family 4 protein [Clostridia bacterium]
MRLLFITNVPSPYRVEFFKELGKYCDLTVLFEKSTSDERDNSWKNYSFEGFNGIILKSVKSSVDKAFCPSVIKYLSIKKFDRIIVADVASSTGMLAIQYMKLFNIPYYIEGDGAFAKSGKGFKEKVKRHFIKGAKGYFSTSLMHDEYYVTYGADKNKIHRYPFSSLKKDDILENIPQTEQKLSLREELGMPEKRIVLTVGQFIHRKGFDVLLNAAKNFSEDIGVYFVGGEPTEEYLKLVEENNLSNIHFIGFKNKSELKKYYIASDIFVLPTREDIWGLVINEAMAYGLPIITTNRCIAGLELVKNGENGYIIPVEDAILLNEKINDIVYNNELSQAMNHRSLEIIKDYTVEKMAERHLEILDKN